MKTWFYTMSGGFAGTNEYGLVQADTEEAAYDTMLPDAKELVENWYADSRGYGYEQRDNGEWFDPETDEEVEGPCEDLSLEPYDPVKHNGRLFGSEGGFIETVWDNDLKQYVIPD